MEAAMLLRAWAASYQRNNKTNGRKNLRCFVRERALAAVGVHC